GWILTGNETTTDTSKQFDTKENPTLSFRPVLTVNYTAPGATMLALTGLPASVTAGASSTFTVTAEDQSGKVATGYTGTVHFTSSDSQATVPADYTFTGADAGIHVFTNGVTFKTAGVQSITATDTTTGSINGSGSSTVTPAAAKSLHFSGLPASTVAGTA